jgi:NTE family protein
VSIIDRPTGTAERVDLLAQVPLFREVTPEELAALAPRFTETTHRKGEVLFTEGDEGGGFFVVVRGELEVLGGGAEKHVVNRLGPGDHLGEVALLLGGRRTATVRVSRAARLLALSADEFRALLEQSPRVLTVIARDLSRQLDARTRQELPRRTTLTVGVSGAPGLTGKSLIAGAVAGLLSDAVGSKALVVDSAKAPRRPAELAALVERAHREYPLVVLDLGSHDAVPPEVLAEVSDVVIEIVAQGEDAPPAGYSPATRVLRVVNLHNRHSRAFAVNRCEPFLLRQDDALGRLAAPEQVAYLRDHPRSPASPTLHRLARSIRGATVGIALAGGAAFGIAHVGVLRVLEDAGVPLDIVAGTSMGSIVGGAYAGGLPAAELADLVVRTATLRTSLSVVDPTAARPALLAGDRLTAVLRDIGLDRDFEDLALPFRAIAADIETGEDVAIGSGDVAAACRASASIPLVFAPVRRDGRLLVDGGVVNQVPARIVREMGADVCIAVTVVPGVGVRTVFSRVSNALNVVNPLSHLNGARGMPAMLDLFIDSFQLVQYQLGSFQARSADVHVEVDASDFTWVSFHRAADLIERGAQTAERTLPLVQAVLAARPAIAG